ELTAHYAQLARTGFSSFQQHSAAGSLILLNLSRALMWDPSPETMSASIERGVAHEYTHFAQRAILGEGSIPGWFEEGQAVYQSARQVGGGYANLSRAAGGQRDGTALRLWQLDAATEQHVHEGGEEGVAVYGRGYAAVAMLAERYGYPATVQLLRDNHDGTLL